MDLTQPSFWLSIASIAFNPTAWNALMICIEYHNKTITRLFGSQKAGCYFLAFMIFSFGMLRDNLFHDALASQPASLPPLAKPFDTYLPIALCGEWSDFGCDLDLGVGHHRDVSRGLLWHSHGRTRRGIPVQHPDKPYVRRLHHVLSRCLPMVPIHRWVGYNGVCVCRVCRGVEVRGPFTDMIYAKREEERA
ncbi:PEMT-domain-containing protein, partial [Hymenopellis radicata]